ncbi:MAG: MFS transporter [Desulfovibrionaceae bacterium]
MTHSSATASAPHPALPPLYKDPNLYMIFCVTFMVVMGVASISPSLPGMVRALGIPPEQVGLVITAFTVPGVLFLPLTGALADRLGRKQVLVPSLLVFGVAGFACGFARDFTTLLVLRFAQGIGGASLGMLNITLISDLYSGPRRVQALGLNASILSIGVAVYPLIGGMLATFGWYAPFFLPLVAVPLAGVVWFKLESPVTPSRQTMGAYFSSTLRGLSTRRAVGCLASSLASFIIIYGPFITFMPLLLDRDFHAPPFLIGCLMGAPSVFTATTASQLGRIRRHARDSTLVIVSFVIQAVAIGIIPFIPSLWLLIVPAMLIGLSNGINIPSIQGILAELAPPQQRAGVMAANAFTLRLGQTLGPLCMGMLFTLGDMRAVYLGGAAVAVAMFFVSMALIRE